MYIDLEYYQNLYGEIDPFVFERLGYEAQTKLDAMTTSLFGVKRLVEFFPTDEYDVERVKRCMAKVVNMLVDAEEVKERTSDGLVSSVNSGSESISYNVQSEISKLNKEQLDRDIRATINEYLSGVTDVNGIGLLYGGN